MSDVTIRTNNAPRFTIDSHELTPAEREQFDYLNWSAIDAGEESATFFRYKGELYDLGTFERTGAPEGWDAAMAFSAWSGLLVRLGADDTIVVGYATW